MQEQEEMRNVENVGLKTGKLETTFEVLLNVIGDILSNLVTSDDAEDGDDEDDDDEEDAELGKLSKDDEPGWGMGTFCIRVQHRMERFRQKRTKLDEVMQPGWGDTADYFGERVMKYGSSELQVPAVVQSQRDDYAPCSVPTTFGGPMKTLDSIPGKSQMRQVTFRPGSSHMTLQLRTPQTHKGIMSLLTAPAPDSSTILISKHVEPVSYNGHT